jgi:hypothetical protein
MVRHSTISLNRPLATTHANTMGHAIRMPTLLTTTLCGRAGQSHLAGYAGGAVNVSLLASHRSRVLTRLLRPAGHGRLTAHPKASHHSRRFLPVAGPRQPYASSRVESCLRGRIGWLSSATTRRELCEWTMVHHSVGYLRSRTGSTMHHTREPAQPSQPQASYRGQGQANNVA